MDESARAHGAGFNRGEDLTTGEAMIADARGRLAQGDDLSMGRGIVVEQVAIMPRADDLIFLNN